VPASIIVTTASDDYSATSLRSAIATANTDAAAGTSDTVTFDPSLNGATISLDVGTLELSGSPMTGSAPIIIDAGSLPDGITLSGDGNAWSDITVDSGVNAVLSGLTITNGGNSSLNGGGINNSGTLTVNNSVIANNSVDGSGGAIYNSSAAMLKIDGSSITGNTSSADGAGIYNDGALKVNNDVFGTNAAGGNGGGIANSSSGTATVIGSTLSGDSATSGGAIETEGILTLCNSTIDAESTSTNGGAIDNSGTMTVIDSTLADNSAASGLGGGINNSGTLTLTNSTLSGNSDSTGSDGLTSTAGSLTVENGLIADGLTTTDTTITANVFIVGGDLDCTSSTLTAGTLIVGNDVNLTDSSATVTTSLILNDDLTLNGSTLTVANATVGDDVSCTTSTLTATTMLVGTDFDMTSGTVAITTLTTSTGDLNMSGGSMTVATATLGGSLVAAGGSLTVLSSLTTDSPSSTPSSVSLDLDTLQNNGGSTQTIALLSGSAAIGAGEAVATLSAGVTDTAATSITVNDGTQFAGSSLPTLDTVDTGYYFMIQVDDELMEVTGLCFSGSDATLTVVRGANATTPATHSSGASLYVVSDQRGYLDAYSSTPTLDVGAVVAEGTPPISFANPGAETNADGDTVYVALSAFDSEGNPSTYSETGLPAGLSINTTTGVISGTISSGDYVYSPYSVAVTAADSAYSGDTITQIFGWSVTASGTITVSLSLSDQTNLEGDSPSVTVSATDSADNALIFHAENLPPGLAIDPSTGDISGTISDGASANSPYTVTVIATDSTNPSVGVSQTLVWTVDSLITLSALPTLTNDIGDPVYNPTFGVDSATNAMSFTATGLPPGLTIDPNCGIVSGIVSDSASISTPYSVTITATDATGAETSVSISWTINAAPTIAATFETVENGSITIEPSDLLAGDPDAGEGSTVAITTPPQFGSWVSNDDGSWTYTPAPGYSGRDLISYTVTHSDSSTFSGVAAISVDPLVQFSTSQYDAGQDASATITVSLTGVATQEVTVDYATADRTAEAGVDYDGVSGTLTIPAGQTSATFTINTLDDSEATDGEHFAINLSSPTHAGLGSIRNAHFAIYVAIVDLDARVVQLNAISVDINNRLEAMGPSEEGDGDNIMDRIDSKLEEMNGYISEMQSADEDEGLATFNTARAAFTEDLRQLSGMSMIADLNRDAAALIGKATDAAVLAQGMRFRIEGIGNYMDELVSKLGDVDQELISFQGRLFWLSEFGNLSGETGQALETILTDLGVQHDQVSASSTVAVAVYTAYFGSAAGPAPIPALNTSYNAMVAARSEIIANDWELDSIAGQMLDEDADTEEYDLLIANFASLVNSNARLAGLALTNASTAATSVVDDSFANEGIRSVLTAITERLAQEYDFVETEIDTVEGANPTELTDLAEIQDTLEKAIGPILLFLYPSEE
jgi:hypothetical protein